MIEKIRNIINQLFRKRKPLHDPIKLVISEVRKMKNKLEEYKKLLYDK